MAPMIDPGDFRRIPGIAHNMCEFRDGQVHGVYAGGEEFGDLQLSMLASFPSIVELQLDYPRIHVESLKHLGALRHLTKLWLYDGSWGAECLPYIVLVSSLKYLSIRLHKPVPVEAFSQLATMENLKQLWIDIPHIRDAEFTAISAALPTCAVGFPE